MVYNFKQQASNRGRRPWDSINTLCSH